MSHVCITRTCYNCYYNSNSLARQELGLKRNFSWKEAQIIGSEITQIDDKPGKDPITEKPKEDPVTKNPKIGPFKLKTLRKTWRRSIELKADLAETNSKKKF